MKIAVINETSAADGNADILAALEGVGHEVINAGMTRTGAKPELTYINTGLLAAILLNSGRVDYVVGGCGTGQGFLNAVMQYPGVFCGHILSPLDAWLFTQINGGNCVSLMLNQAYGWGSDVNLGFIFERIFSVESGAGYPGHRKESQQKSRLTLESISKLAHQAMPKIILALPNEVLMPAIEYPGVWELLDVDSLEDRTIAEALQVRMGG